MLLLVYFCYCLLVWTQTITAAPTTAATGTKILYNGTVEIENKTLIQSSWGPISGLILDRDGVNVSCYLGVPYSEKPIDDKRFSRTKLSKPWKDPLRAVHQPSICYQNGFDDYNPMDDGFARAMIGQDPAMLHYYQTKKSEDCLYLSVFTRDLTRPNKTVLFWVHGGAFVTGSQITPGSYDYSSIAATDSNLIVVAINYRLNVFGFISAGTAKMPGNFGIHDQIVALEWIQKNIESFGGNPSNVVLWGQSAGSTSIGYHIMSHQSGGRSLFNRAIMESGSPQLPITFAKSDYRQKAFVNYLQKLKCTSDDSSQNLTNSNWIDSNLPSILTCLQSKPLKDIFKSYQNLVTEYPIAFLPNANDSSLFGGFDSFWNGIQSGVFPFQNQILIGTNEAEGAQYSDKGPLESFYNFDQISPNFTKPNIIEALLKVIAPNETSLQVILKPILNLLMWEVDEHNYTQNWLRYVQLIGDAVFACPDYYFLQSYANNKPVAPSVTNNNVYYYRFKPGVSHPVDCPRWSPGACHTDELGFVMGNPLIRWLSYPTNEMKLSKSIMSSWIQFAHYGKPDGGNFTIPHWDRYQSSQPQHLLIELNGTRMVSGFPGDRCQSELFPILYKTLDLFGDLVIELIKF